MKKKIISLFGFAFFPIFLMASNGYDVRSLVIRDGFRLPPAVSTIKIDPPKFWPVPTIIKPTITRPTVYPVPINTGTVHIHAQTIGCGNKAPFQGTFRVCRISNGAYMTEDNNQAGSNTAINNSCFGLRTDEDGDGKISLPQGSYIIYSPNTCLKGEMCIMNQKISPMMVDPFEWKIEPQKFFLGKGITVDIQASGTNILLMCPINME